MLCGSLNFLFILFILFCYNVSAELSINCRVDIVNLEDLDMKNHLSGKKHLFLKLSFGTVSALIAAKSFLR